MAFEFDNDGFLSERSSELEDDIYATYHDLFEGARRINHDCHALLFAADIRNRDRQAIIVATLFMRVLDHYQATIILLGRGVVAPARVTLRALVECTLKLRAIAINPDALEAFINEDLVDRLKLINKARNNAYPNLEETRAATTDDGVEELKREITQRGAKEIRTEQWSRLAGMHDWYITNYSLLSKAVHTQVRELEDYLKLGNSDEIQQLHYAPSMDELPLLIHTAAHCVLIAVSAFDKEFEMGFGPKGDEHAKFVDAAFRAIDDGI
ncbi:hypothetical protein GFM44_33315 [Rhizobium leguminosarum bv. viciae]|nr:hypothetical protein [Rhizobium leguminosarum bv. viciae]